MVTKGSVEGAVKGAITGRGDRYRPEMQGGQSLLIAVPTRLEVEGGISGSQTAFSPQDEGQPNDATESQSQRFRNATMH